MMYGIGSTVIDRPTGAPARVAYVERVPPRRDLFGDRVPPHRRYVVVFGDGRWANDRRDADLIPAA